MWDIGLLSANKTHEWTNRKPFFTSSSMFHQANAATVAFPVAGPVG